jgi:hypothetical protein
MKMEGILTLIMSLKTNITKPPFMKRNYWEHTLTTKLTLYTPKSETKLIYAF